MFFLSFFWSNVVDVPSAPRPPIDISGMSKDSLILGWKEPEKDGGSKILDYIIEVKETKGKDWIYVDTTDGNQTHIHIKKLKQKTKYIFKICARNEAGLSLPLITDDGITVDDQISKLTNWRLSVDSFLVWHIVTIIVCSF